MRRLAVGLATGLLLLFTAIVPTAAAAGSQPRDTDNNAMVRGGAYSRAELADKINDGDGRHSGAFLKQDFAKLGVSTTEILSDDMVNGTVTKAGNVLVRDKVVATDARSYGRSFMEGSTKVGNLYSRPPSVSFQSSELDAFVYMPGGHFKYAIIKSCGNFTKATPVAVASKPTPKPAAQVTAPAVAPAATTINVVQTQTQAQTQPQPAPIVVQAVQPAPTPAPAPQPVQTIVTKTVQTLPTTGASVIALLGLSVLMVVAWYYRRSCQDLRTAPLRIRA